MLSCPNLRPTWVSGARHELPLKSQLLTSQAAPLLEELVGAAHDACARHEYLIVSVFVRRGGVCMCSHQQAAYCTVVGAVKGDGCIAEFMGACIAHPVHSTRLHSPGPSSPTCVEDDRHAQLIHGSTAAEASIGIVKARGGLQG